MVKGRRQQGVFGQQQTVTEDIAGHIADTHHAEVFRLGIQTKLAEMTFDRFPGTFSGNPHPFVVITLTAPRGEGIAQPESVLFGDRISNIGEGRSAFIGSHYQVGIIWIETHHITRRYKLAFNQVIRQIQQTPDKDLIASNTLSLDLFSADFLMQIASDKTAFSTDRYDHRVLNLLRLNQTQDFGAEIFLAIRPAQTTAGDLATAQVHTLDPWTVYVGLKHRNRTRNIADLPRAQFKAHIRLRQPLRIHLKVVGSQGGFDQCQQPPHNPIIVEIIDLIQGIKDTVF